MYYVRVKFGDHTIRRRTAARDGKVQSFLFVILFVTLGPDQMRCSFWKLYFRRVLPWSILMQFSAFLEDETAFLTCKLQKNVAIGDTKISLN